jgi:hypothetical protein
VCEAAERTANALGPLRSLEPPDFGGADARRGFAFQDHVAARHCLQMLQPDGPTEVWCETYDDITLVWEGEAGEEAEFVQVKGEQPDQLWTRARLCARTKGARGTSILERSLWHDRCDEPARFRVVTSRQVGADLELLLLDRTHVDRQPGAPAFDRLRSAVAGAVGDFRSAKGHSCDYWLCNAQWEVVDPQGVESSNKLQLTRVLEQLGLPSAFDTVDGVYTDLLGHAKEAAERARDRRGEKRILVSALKAFVERAAESRPGMGPCARLSEKLAAAGLDGTDVATAQDLRRLYREALLAPQYLSVRDTASLRGSLLTLLARLRSRLNSGEIASDGVQFHALCLEEVRHLVEGYPAGETGLPGGFAEGCMYDITSRCRHRFVRTLS